MQMHIKDLRGFWAKVHQICSHGNLFIDGINATIRVAIRIHPLSNERGDILKKSQEKHKPAGITMQGVIIT